MIIKHEKISNRIILFCFRAVDFLHKEMSEPVVLDNGTAKSSSNVRMVLIAAR